jgi:hypothetical protein
MTLPTVGHTTWLTGAAEEIRDKNSEEIFQKTSQDPKSTCYHLLLKYYFTSEQLKVFKENPCSLNTLLHAERGKEMYDSAKCLLSTEQRFFQASNWMICWLYTVCIYSFAIDNRRLPFLQLLWIGWKPDFAIFIYILLIEATARERTVFVMCCKYYCDVSICLTL